MGKVVHKTKVSNMSKPILAFLAGSCEELSGNVVEDVTMQEANHPEEFELLQVKKDLTRTGSGVFGWSFRRFSVVSFTFLAVFKKLCTANVTDFWQQRLRERSA